VLTAVIGRAPRDEQIIATGSASTDPKTIQTLLRDADVAATLGIYAHTHSEARMTGQGDMPTAFFTASARVAVTASIRFGGTPSCSSKRATRRINAKVLPVPGPATMRSGIPGYDAMLSDAP
jgi:hypothetical protein